MQLKTILNHVEKQKGFVYCEARWSKALSSHARICCQPMKVLRERAPATLNILDRFHISKKFGEALDKIRAEKTRQLEADGYEPILKHSRWCLLKRRENLTPKQTVKLRELLKYNLNSMKAYLMREDFNRFWTYTSPTCVVGSMSHLGICNYDFLCLSVTPCTALPLRLALSVDRQQE